MTKYLNPSFNSPANNKNYNDNYDRIFKKEGKNCLKCYTLKELDRLKAGLIRIATNRFPPGWGTDDIAQWAARCAEGKEEDPFEES